MTTIRRLSGAAVMAVGLAMILAPSVARAQIMLQATLDAAQEVPAPTGVPAGAGGTATFTYDDESKMLSFTATVHDLSGPAIAAHIHQGAPGVAGGILFPLDPTATSGTVGPLNATQETALFSGQLYINYHTPQNPSGEIRGQIELVAGKCACSGFSNHGQFVKCVRKAIKGLTKAERKDSHVKALKKATAQSSCGKTKGPKKAVACCLPRNPEDNIVTDALCVAVKDAQCAGKGGTSRGSGSSCFPTNPCSPSGAFLDSVTF